MSSNKPSPALEKRVALDLAAFLDGGAWKPLGLSKEAASALAKAFLEVCYRDLGVPPEKLEESELRQALFEILPTRLGREQEGARKAPDLAGALLRKLGEETLNPNAWKFPVVIEEASREFPKLLGRIGGTAIPDAPSKPFERPGEKLGRNDPCPCGSGKKYKKCCGAA